ncbi:MAG: hypothetical protein AUI14_07505 [Actinobacteria bacterium 13_2_20CM_2_71_6]|nr:MAG: hypothetical protein AUI14_07505 [Actinobacteria bacterium 13_2_20CM_2_71_6]
MKKVPLLALALVAFTVSGCAQGTTNAPLAVPPPDGMLRTDGCATHTSPPAMTIDGTPQPANQNDLAALAGRVQPYADAHFADVYTGLELRSETDRIRVYRKPSAAFDAWIVKEFARDCVEVVDTAHNQRELQALADRISADMAYWQAQRLPINSVGASIDGTVNVGTTEVDRARRELPQRYGTDIAIVVVFQGPIMPA